MGCDVELLKQQCLEKFFIPNENDPLFEGVPYGGVPKYKIETGLHRCIIKGVADIRGEECGVCDYTWTMHSYTHDRVFEELYKFILAEVKKVDLESGGLQHLPEWYQMSFGACYGNIHEDTELYAWGQSLRWKNRIKKFVKELVRG